jgi:hypothetical protein
LVDFINEVEEELRKDKYNVLLRKFGPYIVAVIIVIVAATGYLEFQKYSNGVAARKTSASFMVADKIEKTGDLQSAIEKFLALSEVAPSGYAGLSLSRAAGLKQQLGDQAGAVNLFDKAAEVFEKPVHKDLASLKAAYILMEQGRYADVTARASSLSGADAPYKDLAKELLGHAALKSDNEAGAREHFTYLANVPGVTPGVQQRAENALLLINANRAVPAPDAETVTTEPAPEAAPEIAEDTETDIPEPTTPDETSEEQQ